MLDAPGDVDARGGMLLGAHLAGLAIEASMLGATHACANPLSARYGTTHGVAIALMLPHVVRWNGRGRGAALRGAVAGRRAPSRVPSPRRRWPIASKSWPCAPACRGA